MEETACPSRQPLAALTFVTGWSPIVTCGLGTCGLRCGFSLVAHMAKSTTVTSEAESVSVVVTYLTGLLITCMVFFIHMILDIRWSVCKHATFFTFVLLLLVTLSYMSL